MTEQPEPTPEEAVMSKLLRTIARREQRYLEAKGVAGEIIEARLTWKRRSKKPLRENHPTAPGESDSGDAAAGSLPRSCSPGP